MSVKYEAMQIKAGNAKKHKYMSYLKLYGVLRRKWSYTVRND